MKGSHEVSLALQFESKIFCLLDCRVVRVGRGKECVCNLLCLGASFSEKDDDSLLEGVIAYLVKLSAIIFVYFSPKI
jgi:hypothetical protein